MRMSQASDQTSCCGSVLDELPVFSRRNCFEAAVADKRATRACCEDEELRPAASHLRGWQTSLVYLDSIKPRTRDNLKNRLGSACNAWETTSSRRSVEQFSKLGG